MEERNEILDRRENMRFPVRSYSIAVMGPLENGLGDVIDLSVDGFSFRYDSDENLLLESTESLTLFGEEDLCLGQVTYKAVSDREIRPGRADTPRRCGVKFGKLSQSQEAQLKNFIWNHACVEV